MQGDRLARGDRSAAFPPPDTSDPHKKNPLEVDVEKPHVVFCECRDCPRVFFSAREFSAHLSDCKAAA